MERIRLKVAPRGLQRGLAAMNLDDYVEISERGLRPSSDERLWIPVDTIRSITVDKWIGAGRGSFYRHCATAHLTDGRMVMLPGLTRDWGRHVEHVVMRRGEDRDWTPFEAGDGTAWAWGPTDHDPLIRHLTALLHAAGALGTATDEAAAALKLRALEGHPRDPLVNSLPALLRALRPRITRYRRWSLAPVSIY